MFKHTLTNSIVTIQGRLYKIIAINNSCEHCSFGGKICRAPIGMQLVFYGSRRYSVIDICMQSDATTGYCYAFQRIKKRWY